MQTICATNVSIPAAGGITLYRQWVMRAYSAQGDSGGPVFYGTIAGGIISTAWTDEHCVDLTGYGTMAQIILRAWRPCYTSTC